MLRFIAARELCAIFTWSYPASRLAKGQVNLMCLPQSRMCLQKVNFFTKSPYRKDAPLPTPGETSNVTPDDLDLDKWKVVMRSKAVAEEKAQAGDEDDDEEEEEEEKTEGKSTLEETRALVILWRDLGKKVPKEMSDEELQVFAEMPTKSARKKYLKFLATKEWFQRKKKKRQDEKKVEGEVKGDEGDKTEKKGMPLLLNLDKSSDRMRAWRCAQAMMFGQPLVFDLSYEDNMSRREKENTASQLLEVIAFNKRATEPYHLHFCNVRPDSYCKQRLITLQGAEAWDRLLLTSTDKQYFELFPRKQLVYLTADSPHVLRTYDHNKVYIVGGLVDRSGQCALSLANAKRFNLATARLPLNELLQWKIGTKNLTLDQMIRILLILKETGNWKEALQFVPKRKHEGFNPDRLTSFDQRLPRLKLGRTKHLDWWKQE